MIQDETGAEIRLLRHLRAVRSFQPTPVPDDALDDILQVARWTGSAKNEQEWQLIVVTEPATLEALGRCSPTTAHVGRAPMAIAIVMPGERKIMEAFDEGRLAERIMLAALAHGLGSSIGWVADGEETAKQVLGVPADRKLRTLISLGLPDERARRPRTAPGTARKPIDEIVQRERWQRG